MNILKRFELVGKVAIITGASKGIGKAIAFALGQAGAKVVVSSRNQAAVDEIAKDFAKQGIQAIGVAAHVGDSAQLDNLVTKTLNIFGGIDIIVNNAATNPVFGPVINTSEMAFDKIMDINVKAPFELSKKAFASMQERGGGSIINISSIGGISPEDYLGVYSVSKAALLSLTKVLGKEWGEYNIRVNAICPGLIKTKFSRALWQDEKILKRFLKNQPIARIGEPEDMAAMALFLASDASTYCTGSVFTADGGYTI
ncbi:MAG: glucose 1-dehydrogenase [Chitinophagales bacterium]